MPACERVRTLAKLYPQVQPIQHNMVLKTTNLCHSFEICPSMISYLAFDGRDSDHQLGGVQVFSINSHAVNVQLKLKLKRLSPRQVAPHSIHRPCLQSNCQRLTDRPSPADATSVRHIELSAQRHARRAGHPTSRLVWDPSFHWTRIILFIVASVPSSYVPFSSFSS